MDDEWGYPYFRNPPFLNLGFRVVVHMMELLCKLELPSCNEDHRAQVSYLVDKSTSLNLTRPASHPVLKKRPPQIPMAAVAFHS